MFRILQPRRRMLPLSREYFLPSHFKCPIKWCIRLLGSSHTTLPMGNHGAEGMAGVGPPLSNAGWGRWWGIFHHPLVPATIMGPVLSELAPLAPPPRCHAASPGFSKAGPVKPQGFRACSSLCQDSQLLRETLSDPPARSVSPPKPLPPGYILGGQ